MTITVRQATASDAKLVAKLVHMLLAELALAGRTSPAPEQLQQAAMELVGTDAAVWAFIAGDTAGNPLGVLTLNECAAIYAGGRFGEISELYVTPEGRSKGVGAMLLVAAREFGTARKWKRLEVGAPDMPRWKRTVDFYRNNGFVEVGPRLRVLL